MPRSYHDYDDEQHELEELFAPSERPTVNEKLRRVQNIARDDPDFALGRVMIHTMELRRDVIRLTRIIEGMRNPRPSLRPHVQTAGVSASVAAIIAVISQILHQAGVLK